MKISLDVVLKDKPGQLVKLLEPISDHGANVISIVHLRETTTEGRVPVHVSFEVNDVATQDKITRDLENNNIWVAKVGEIKRKERHTFLLIGHIVDTDLRDTIDRIHEIKGAIIADVGLSMPDPEKESSARIDIDVNPKNMDTVLERIDEIAKEKDLMVIKPLGV